MLTLKHINKSYGNRTILSDISLSIRKGEIVSILGPSGCGKTTLLNLILGLTQATSGKIMFDGEDLTNVPMQKRGFNIVFQDFALFPNLNAHDNIVYGLRNNPSASTPEEVNELIVLLGLRKHLHQRIDELSGGQKQRVAIARTLVLKPRILLLDERVAQTKLTLGLLRSNLDKVRSLQRNGAAMQSDADAVEAELLTVEQQLAQVEASRESYRRMLELFIGEELAGRALVRPDVAEPASFEAARPELALFDATADKLTAQERLVKAATRPRFGLFAQGYYGYPGMDYFESMMSNDWSWNALVGFRMSWNFGAFYTKKNSLGKLRTAQRQLDVQRDVFLFNTRLQTVEESGDIARLRRALADDDRIVQLRRAVREAAESKLRNGVIDTNDLLRKITEEATAATARSAREIELVKTIYELKHTINR